MHKEEGLSFKNVITFNLDEYVVDKNKNPDFYSKYESYHGFMQEHLFKHIDIKPENINVPDGMATDLNKECREYEKKIKDAGGIDLQLVGIGVNGHIGFCEPGSPLNGQTSVVNLAQKTVDVNNKKFGFAAPQALSMGLGTVADAREILLIATGESKAPIIENLGSTAIPNPYNIPRLVEMGESVENMVNEPVKNNPSIVLKLHKNVTAYVDEAAAGKMLDRYSKIAVASR